MDIEMTMENIFPTPIWVADLSVLAPHGEAMLESALEFLNRHPSGEETAFLQSQPTLHQLADPNWERFYELFGTICTNVVKSVFASRARLTRGISESWVVKIDDTAEYRHYGGELGLLHSHRGGLLSSVFYLDVPDELVGTPLGGTMFRDPDAAQANELRSTYHRVTAQPFTLLLFPSYLEHAPSRPELDTTYTRPRVVVASDFA